MPSGNASSSDTKSAKEKVESKASEQSSNAEAAHNVKTKGTPPGRPVYTSYTASNGFDYLVGFTGYDGIAEKILDLEMRSDDVIVSTYPKAGTTWMQEIVWLICNNADIAAAKETRLHFRYNFMEFPGHTVMNGFPSLESWPTDKTRFIKTHLPFELLPREIQEKSKCKMVYVARNPKDCCVSYYHFHRMNQMLPEPGTWSEFLSNFSSGQICWGSWFPHVSKYWETYQQRKDSIHFVTYEALKKDLRGEITKIATFLKKPLTDKQLDVIAHHCTFDSMSTNKSTNYSDSSSVLDLTVSKFMRKGEVGDWKNHFTEKEDTAFKKLYEEKTKDWTLSMEFE